MKLIPIISFLVLIAACSTPYQSGGFTGGFEEQQLAADTFIVSAKGNAFTSMESIKTYTLRRAAELAVANRYGYFVILEGGEHYKTGVITTPGTYQSTTTGSYTSGTYTPGTTTSIEKPRASITVKMFNLPLPEGVNAYDAQEVLKYTSNVAN